MKYVERLVAQLDPSEFKVAIISTDAPGLPAFEEALKPFQVEWISPQVPNPTKRSPYQALVRVNQRASPPARIARLPGVREVGKTMLGLLALVDQARRLRHVDRTLHAARPDILHVNLDRFPDASGKLALLAGHAAGAHTVVATLHPQVQSPIFPRPIHHHFDRRALKRADRIIVVAQKQKRELEKWYGVRPDSIQVIPNGAAHECFTRRASRLERQELGFKTGDFLVVHVGSIFPGRGQLVLGQALCAMRTSYPLIRAAFVGDVIDKRYSASLLELLDSQPGKPFRWFGYRGDALEILRLADAAVIASFEEGHSFALVEAMALGKPIVATDLESNVESLGQGEAGLLVATGDTEAVADGLAKLYRDPALRLRIGEAARARAIRLYTQERMVQATLDVYRGSGW